MRGPVLDGFLVLQPFLRLLLRWIGGVGAWDLVTSGSFFARKKSRDWRHGRDYKVRWRRHGAPAATNQRGGWDGWSFAVNWCSSPPSDENTQSSSQKGAPAVSVGPQWFGSLDTRDSRRCWVWLRCNRGLISCSAAFVAPFVRWESLVSIEKCMSLTVRFHRGAISIVHVDINADFLFVPQPLPRSHQSGCCYDESEE